MWVGEVGRLRAALPLQRWAPAIFEVAAIYGYNGLFERET